jgi:hypothetical protein
MARWRTSVAAAAGAAVVVLFTTACGHTGPNRDAAASSLPSKAQLAPAGQKPLQVRGTGFLPDEHVQVTTKGKTVNSVANSQGAFFASLPGVNNCGGATVTATGDEGSHAKFNLSQVSCNGS